MTRNVQHHLDPIPIIPSMTICWSPAHLGRSAGSSRQRYLRAVHRPQAWKIAIDMTMTRMISTGNTPTETKKKKVSDKYPCPCQWMSVARKHVLPRQPHFLALSREWKPESLPVDTNSRAAPAPSVLGRFYWSMLRNRGTEELTTQPVIGPEIDLSRWEQRGEKKRYQ